MHPTTMVTAVTARSGFSTCLNTGSSDATDVTMPSRNHRALVWLDISCDKRKLL